MNTTIRTKNKRLITKYPFSKYPYIKCFIILLLILLAFLAFYPRVFVFIVRSNDLKSETLSAHFLRPGEGFSLKYNHSVEKSPVVEIYKIKPTGGFILDSTIFQSYGAGLPLESKNFSIENGHFIIRDMDINFPRLRIRVSRTPSQTITINKTKYKLQQISSPGKLIIVKCGSLIDYILFKLSLL